MNLVRMLQMAEDHTRYGEYQLAKNLAKRIGDILEAAKGAPDKLGEEALCCCPLKDRTEVGLTSCTACFWQIRANLADINGRLGLA